LCITTGSFEITVTLHPGKNEIVARTVDWVGQYGPDSETLVIFYDVAVPESGGPGNRVNDIPPLHRHFSFTPRIDSSKALFETKNNLLIMKLKVAKRPML
jgi:hypothetical protein